MAGQGQGWLAGVLAAGLIATSAQAAPVAVRSYDHGRYGRMVFDWPSQVSFEARVEGNELVIRFGEPIEARLDAVVRNLAPYLSAGRIGSDGRSVVFALKQAVTLHSFRSGNAVAVDVAGTGRPPPPAAAAPPSQTGAPGAAPASAAPPPATPSSPRPEPRRATAERVRVRAGEHNDYSRLVVEWPQPAGYAINRDGGAVRILFDRPGRADLQALQVRRYHNIKALSVAPPGSGAGNDGLVLALSVPPGAELRDSRSGNLLVLDILDPPKPGAIAPPTAPVAGGAGNPGAPAVAPVAPATSAAAAPVPAAPAEPPPPGPPVPPTGIAAPPPVQPEPASPVMVFDTGGPAAAAIFERLGYLYVVFDRAVPVGSGTLTGAPTTLVGKVEPVPALNGTAFRFMMSALLQPAVERSGTQWRIVFQPRQRPAITELEVERQPDFPIAPRLLIHAADAATVVQFSDPTVGDALMAVPLPVPGQAVGIGRRLSQLELLPALQGIAIRPRGDAIVALPVREGIELKAPGGLLMAGTADSAVATAPARSGAVPAQVAAAPPRSVAPAGQGTPAADSHGASIAAAAPGAGMPPHPVSTGPLFDLVAWQRGPIGEFTDNRQALQDAVTNAPPADKIRARLDLARFYFAHGFAHEANGLLTMLAEQQPDLNGWAEFRAMRAAAQITIGAEPQAGESDLSGADLAGRPEASLWRGTAVAARRDWAEAVKLFKQGDGVLAGYPDPYRRRLTLIAADAYLKTGQPNEAARLLDRLLSQIAVPAAPAGHGEGHGAPAHGVPDHGAPAPGAPAHGAPAHGTPAQGAPAGGSGGGHRVAADGLPGFGFSLVATANAAEHGGGGGGGGGGHGGGGGKGGGKGETPPPPSAVDGPLVPYVPDDPAKAPAILYLRGEIARQQNHPDQAIEMWKEVLEGRDRLYRARAGLALVNLQLDQKQITPESAAERMAALRFAWRGDELELDIIQRQGEVQWLAGQYAEGLGTMREAAGYFPDSPRAAAITKNMSTSFAALFKDGARALPPVKALEFYDQFRELTPVGTDGDAIIRQLAERLVEIDLLGRAGELLQHQVDYRLAGQQKAEVGTRLAAIRLLDGKPDLAIKALDSSNLEGLPAGLTGERRLMRARALSDLKRGDEAMALLANDNSKPANLLRVDIAWRDQKWVTAAAALDKAIGPVAAGAKPDPETAQLILNRAVALALAGDDRGLETLRAEFGAAMDKGPLADAFKVVTRPEESVTGLDLKSIRSRVAEVDVFQNFLKNYKSRDVAAAPGS